MDKIDLKVKLLNDNAKLPTYGSVWAAGMDVCAADSFVVPAGKTRLVKTGIAVSWSSKRKYIKPY